MFYKLDNQRRYENFLKRLILRFQNIIVYKSILEIKSFSINFLCDILWYEIFFFYKNVINVFRKYFYLKFRVFYYCNINKRQNKVGI